MNEVLSRLLREEDTVLFIGSGVSAWSKLPSWGFLLEKIADYLDSLGKDTATMRRDINTDPVKAADYAISPDRLSEAALGRFLRDECQFGAAQPHAIHHKIVTLGPRCFVTTNYDHLLEDALRAEYRSRAQLMVKNNQPIEIAEIIGARAKDYVYKLHGDIDDSASLILARSQYRRLLENGERKSALDALRTLLVTRPVVFIGFGLRDLDFLLVQDELQNLWKGVPREHYAILPDASPDDSADWLRNYGIRVVSYATVPRPEGGRDHAALLPLLDELRLPPAPAAALPPTASFDTPATRLALLRYANGLADSPTVSPEIPLRVHAARHTRADTYRHDHSPLQKFLDEGPARAVLIGLPGAGKTYALKQAAARAAQHLRAADQADTFDTATVVVPLLADFKLYEGSIQQLLEKSLPGSLSLSGLASTFRLLILLDSFNEMPREQWERETHETDLAAFLQQFPTARILISSRTEEGLSKLNLPTYTIDEIEAGFLQEELQRRGMDLSGRFKSEMFGLLSKPFFFQLVARNKVALPAEPRPRDIYESYFTALAERFMHRFGVAFDVARALCSAAYEAINSGQEAMPVATIAQVLRRTMQGANMSVATPEEIIAWLVGEDVLLTYSGRRVAFFHQSVTEYLAATELARRYVENPAILLQKLAFTRWDQALFLTLSILPNTKSTEFLNKIIEYDFGLAIKATKYLEAGREEVVSNLLEHILENESNHSELGQIPVSKRHENLLRQLFGQDGENSWEAAFLLVEICGISIKDEFLDLALSHPENYKISNAILGASYAIAPFINLVDIENIVKCIEKSYLNHLKSKLKRAFKINNGYGAMIQNLAVRDVAAIALAPDKNSNTLSIRAEFLNFAIDFGVDESNLVSSEDVANIGLFLLLRDEPLGLIFLNRINTVGINITQAWALINKEHIDIICQYLTTEYCAEALESLCNINQARPDLRAHILQAISLFRGYYRVFILTALHELPLQETFEVLKGLLTLSAVERATIPLSLLQSISLNWRNNEQLFIDLLRLHDNIILASPLIQHFSPGDIEISINVNFGPVNEWLSWLSDLHKIRNRAGWNLRHKLELVLGRPLYNICKDKFLLEFNLPTSPYRWVLADLMSNWNLTTDDFSDETQHFLLAQLDKRNNGTFLYFLGRTATEAFVQENLLPLRNSKLKTLKANLLSVLETAGKRHRRRYLLPIA